ncbi:restriction endonuclease subunit S [Lysobacter gummosus]|uniref:Restriction endonuclease subunit S n=1 Tax=Lysobacter gummosus TaxID=262324 RepID=A0ABY3XGF9_9GAMM|nr:restriction endonuclease subunit S [Lysobacter gummosus]UNP30734.1 restriction endonuclease subunit S [Lysobacter gummosus]
MSIIIRIMRNDAKIITLGAVADVRQGYPFRGAIPEAPTGNVRVIQMKDLTRAGLRDCDSLITTEVDGRKGPDWLRDQDLLFVARGTSNYAVLLDDPPQRTVCSPHLYVIRVTQLQRLLPGFLAWQLNQLPAQRYLHQSAEGSHQLSIRRTELEKVEIRIPPIEQQRAVIELERTANAEREALKALINNREAELAAVAERLLG